MPLFLGRNSPAETRQCHWCPFQETEHIQFEKVGLHVCMSPSLSACLHHCLHVCITVCMSASLSACLHHCLHFSASFACGNEAYYHVPNTANTPKFIPKSSLCITPSAGKSPRSIKFDWTLRGLTQTKHWQNRCSFMEPDT